MDYYTREEAAQTASALSPMAARIMVFLFLQPPGLSFTGKELAARLGTSKQTVSAAVGNLEANGLVQNNGKNHGWSMLPEFYQARLLDHSQSNQKLVQKFLNQPEVSSKIFESSQPLLVDVVNSLDSEREDQQQSIRSGDSSKNFESTPDHSGTKQRAQILRQYGVSGRVTRRYSHPPCPETAVILALCWESATMPLNNPGGWIYCQLRDGVEPGDDFLELARFWLSLDSDGRADFNAAWYSGRPAIDLADDLAAEFDLSQAAAELAVQLRPLKAFEE